MSAFSDNLVRFRKEMNVSQEEVAARLGVRQNTLSQYENGKREPDINCIKKIARFFDVSTDVLLGFEQKPPIGETAMCACHGDEKDGTTIQWHSVKNDGLPKDEDSYLVVVRTFNHGLLERRQDMIMEFKDGGFRNNAYLNERCYEVTHWAHRLALPEENA